jgi:acetylornithine deacetylase/succinyl-diaminopimelate desuccinylase-like protein
MPTSGRPGIARRNIGHGVGCAYMLERGIQPDAAIIVKPGYSVSWEEVGLTWHTVTIRGARNYTGIRHRLPYRNPIIQAPIVIDGLEAFFRDYSQRHTDGLVSPQGSIGALRAGAGDLSAFVPETCELFVDLRVGPRSSPQEVRTELEAALAALRREHPDLDVTSEMTVAVDGTATPPDHWIVASLIRAWEAREGKPHQPATGTSGATDAAILRGHNIPTARIGPPPAATPSPHPGFSMGVADIDSLATLVDVLLYSMVDSATRTRAELGLPTA